MVNDILGSLKEVLEGDDNSDHDNNYMFKSATRDLISLPAGARGVPSWAPPNIINCRGLVAVSKAHYLALAVVNGRLIEVMVDTGGARTMVDRMTAIKLGLNVKWSCDNPGIAGTFSGVSGNTTEYLGVAVGPIKVQFSDKVTLHLDEIKVFDYPEPIVLIGTDLLGHTAAAPYTFSYVGVNPTT